MVGINVEVTYYGKEKKVDPRTKRVIEHRWKMATLDYPKGDWKENLPKELRRVIDKFEGIREVRFFVGRKIEEKQKEKEKK